MLCYCKKIFFFFNIYLYIYIFVYFSIFNKLEYTNWETSSAGRTQHPSQGERQSRETNWERKLEK